MRSEGSTYSASGILINTFPPTRMQVRANGLTKNVNFRRSDGNTVAWLLIFAVALLLGGVVALIYQSRKPRSASDVSTTLAIINEKLSHIEPMAQAVGGVQVELRGLTERVSTVEQNQNAVDSNLRSLETGVVKTSVATNSLIEATTAIRNELSRAREGLTELKTHAEARQDVEQRTAESVRRLEAVIAGTQTRGAAGENILEALFAKLPAEWQVRNFRVGNKFVEFGLRLPNNRILPIDSKWAAAHLVEQISECEDSEQMLRLKSQLEGVVLQKAREVRKYIDPALTVNFGVAAVPDAVYDLCSGVHVQVFQLNVVLVSYSMFVPYLLLVFQTTLKTSQNIDMERLTAYLQTAQDSIATLQEELEGRFARSIIMLQNSRNDMSIHLSKIATGLTSLQISADPNPNKELEA